jgi:hypothetical protein
VIESKKLHKMRLIVIKEAAGPKPLASLSAVWKAAIAKTRRKMAAQSARLEGENDPKGGKAERAKRREGLTSMTFPLDTRSTN